MPIKQKLSTILKNQSINENFFMMEFSWDEDLAEPSPGNFLTIRISEDTVPLLRRPFAFSGYNPLQHTATIIYQRRGRGTELLSVKQPGETIDIIGPLGNNFQLPKSEGIKSILVAGGIGLGPILFLSDTLKKMHSFSDFIFGCRNSALIPKNEYFLKQNPIICTDDGSSGFHGTTGAYLLSKFPEKISNHVLYCCGPHPMLKSCHTFSVDRNIDCFVSVEQIMACGVGACMGCVVKTRSEAGFSRACKEGPVFSSTYLLWD